MKSKGIRTDKEIIEERTNNWLLPRRVTVGKVYPMLHSRYVVFNSKGELLIQIRVTKRKKTQFVKK